MQNPHNAYPWTDAQRSELKRLVAEGRPGVEIRCALGVSHAIMAGELWRLGLRLPTAPKPDEVLLAGLRAFKAERGSYPRIGSDGGWHPDDAALAQAVGLPNSSTVCRRFRGLKRACAQAEGKPLIQCALKGRRLTLREGLDLLNVYRHLAGRFPGGTTGCTEWVHQDLADRVALPSPNHYRRTKGGTSSLLDAYTQAKKLPLNEALLHSFNLTDAEKAEFAVREKGSRLYHYEDTPENLCKLAHRAMLLLGHYPKSKGSKWTAEIGPAERALGRLLPSPAVYVRHFGTLARAWEAVDRWAAAEAAKKPKRLKTHHRFEGLKLRVKTPRLYTYDDLIPFMKALLAKRGGVAPSVVSIPFMGPILAKRHLNGIRYSELVERAGGKLSSRGQHMAGRHAAKQDEYADRQAASANDLLVKAVLFKRHAGRYPRSGQNAWAKPDRALVRKLGLPPATTYTHRFGVLTEAWNQADILEKTYLAS